MNATLLSIGDELLIGQTLNTNVAWISRKLNEIGVDVKHHITLSDDRDDIVRCLDQALAETQVVLITGGLGPTSDDITKDVLNDYFGGQLVFNEAAFQNIENIFRLRKRLINDDTRRVAYVPDNCHVIQNSLGTAPGMLFRLGDQVIVSMPGVPYEMQAMMDKGVVPYLREHFQLPVILHVNILTAGAGETTLAERLRDFERDKDPRIKLAYLPNVGKVRLRLTLKGNNEMELRPLIENAKETVVQAVSDFIFGYDDDLLEKHIGDLLCERQLQLGLAESCSGGYIAHLITSVPGSSDYFKGSVVSYSNEAKERILGVKPETLEQFGAVSDETVREMIRGALEVLHCDVAIAVSGVAGPSGGSPEKPVGTVFVGVGSHERIVVKKLSFTNHRERNIQLSGVSALVMLRKFLLGQWRDA